MKYALTVIIFLCGCLTCISQNNDTVIVLKVQKAAQFSKGEKAWHKYFYNKLKSENIYKELQASLPKGKTQYNIKAKFVVSNSGKISNVEVESNLPDSIKPEIKRIINESPDWIPAYNNKVAVNSRRKLSWRFTINKKCE